MCACMWKRKTRKEGILAPEKGQTACLKSFILSSKVGHTVIPKKKKKQRFLVASPIIGSGNMAMNKNTEKPLKLLGRVMANVMFKDICYMPEARSKLRSQCTTYLMERVIWVWNRAEALRIENSGQALNTDNKTSYSRGMKRQKTNGMLGFQLGWLQEWWWHL